MGGRARRAAARPPFRFDPRQRGHRHRGRRSPTGTTGPCSGQQRDTAIRFMEYFFSAVGLIAGAGSVVTLAVDPGRQPFRGRHRHRQRLPPRGGCVGGPDPFCAGGRALLGPGDAIVGGPGGENVGSSPGNDPDPEGGVLPGGRRCPDRGSLRPAARRPRRRCLRN